MTLLKRFPQLAGLTRLTVAIALILLVGAASRGADADKAGPVPGLQLAPGLGATVWASEPMLENPVAVSFDDRGRCYIAETHRWSQSVFDITKQPSWLLEDLSFRTVADRSNFLARTFATNFNFLTKDSERVRWVEDRGGVGHADAGGVFATGFDLPTAGTAAGVLARGNEVWFANIPDLWRLESTSASGQADRREVLHTGFGVHIGVSGHDLHGLKFGPDGRLYFSIGDRGFNLRDESTRALHRPGWNFSLEQPDSGAVLRCEPDGSNLEVFAIGVRNPQELTFDAFGNLWTGDNDTAGADESRLLYLVEGGDYGWRCSYQHQVGFGPWVQEDLWRGGLDDALPTSGMVSQGPAGLDVYPGTGLGAAWNGHFLMCDFPGGIWDFTVTNHGAGFLLGSRNKFAWGLWPTDVEFGPDGAVYAVDWVAGWDKPQKGRIYRISSTGAQDPLASETQRLLREGFPQRTDDELVKLLAHPDQRIRLRAQWALATRGAAGASRLQQAVSGGSTQFAKLHGIWGLGQAIRAGGSTALPAVAAEASKQSLVTALDSAEGEVRAQAAKQLGELQVPSASDRLSRALTDPDPRVRFFAAISLGRLGAKSALEPVLGMLRQNADRDVFLRHAGMMALLGISDPVGLAALRHDGSPAVRRASLLALRRLKRPEVALYLNDLDPDLNYQAARAINDAPINEAMPQLAAFLGKVDCASNLVARAINANFRLGDARNATVLANYANRVDAPEPLRVLALEALGDWAKPSPLDRVMGLWRPVAKRPAEPGRRALRAVAASLHRSRSDAVKIAAMRAATSLGVQEVGNGLYESLSLSNTSPAVRVEVLRTLASLHHARWGEALASGLNDEAPTVRAEALTLAADQPTPAVLTSLARFLAPEAGLPLRQTALRVLGRVADPAAEPMLKPWMEKLLAGQVEAALVLDVLDAVRERPEPSLKTLLSQYESRLPKDNPLASFQPVLHGGDSAKGKNWFFDKADIACLRCHRVWGVGGTVGPVLDGVGKRLKREEILESILRPNARIAVGFEQTQITTTDGQVHAGLVKSESDTEVILENLEDGVMKLAKSGIKSRVRGQSAMPEGLEKLMTLRELRDLVEYLSNL